MTDAEVEIRYVIPTHPSSEHIRFCHLRKDYFPHPDLIRADHRQTSHPIRVTRERMLTVGGMDPRRDETCVNPKVRNSR